jgi:hypothetical protein
MPDTFDDPHWDVLLQRIRDGKCTPFLGAGACHPFLPTAKDVALSWAQEHSYFERDASRRSNLAVVAQYLAVTRDPMFPKHDFVRRIQSCDAPDFFEEDEPHGVLADLPLPIYLTTNCDDFIVRALESRQKAPVRDMCQWTQFLRESAERESESELESRRAVEPDPRNPLVFHLHGVAHQPRSLVLTEDDYLEFLVSVSQGDEVLPARVKEALTDSSLLFVGYSLQDLTFRVLWQGLVAPRPKGSRYGSVSVQLVPVPDDATEEERRAAKEYWEEYFAELKVRVYWGTARQFARELRSRWQQASDG